MSTCAVIFGRHSVHLAIPPASSVRPAQVALLSQVPVWQQLPAKLERARAASPGAGLYEPKPPKAARPGFPGGGGMTEEEEDGGLGGI